MLSELSELSGRASCLRHQALAADYYFNMFYDDLPIWGFIGKVEKVTKPGGDEIRYFLFTHGKLHLPCTTWPSSMTVPMASFVTQGETGVSWDTSGTSVAKRSAFPSKRQAGAESYKRPTCGCPQCTLRSTTTGTVSSRST